MNLLENHTTEKTFLVHFLNQLNSLVVICVQYVIFVGVVLGVA